MVRGRIFGFGIFLLILAITGYVIPINDFGWTIPEASSLCGSDLSGFGESFSKNAQQTCTQMNYLILGIYGTGIIGIALLIVCVLIPSKSKKENFLVCNYCDFIGFTEKILQNHYDEVHPYKKK